MKKNLFIKIRESCSAVLPITAIVLLLHFTISPMPTGLLAMFLFGAVFLILGMGIFTLGADMAMMPMGEKVGASLTHSKRLWLLIVISFVFGMVITIAEPDLTVLARQVPSVPDLTLIVTVACGVGIFLVLALLRVIFQIRLSTLLLIFYGIVFLLAAFSSVDFVSVAFDSGGVTTGPITVPFIMALGIGVASVRGDRTSRDDSFGLVALCSIGPILSVLLLGLFFDSSSGSYGVEQIEAVQSAGELFRLFGGMLPEYMWEVFVALAPIVIFFALFQAFSLKLSARQLIKMGVGVLYTYFGLVFFLTGVNAGFLSAGSYLGKTIAALPYRWILIPLGMIIGFFIVAAEPAVHVLNKQVEEISNGSISRRSMLMTLSIGVSVAIGLAMLRILTGISIWYCILPGYVIALALTFFVPKIYTAIAFDSGGVASGPMTATFLLPFAMGACESTGGNVLTDAFGIVALVAMTPLIAIQILGLISHCKNKKAKQSATVLPEAPEEDIIEL